MVPFAGDDNKNITRTDQNVPPAMMMHRTSGLDYNKLIKVRVLVFLRIMFSIMAEKIYPDLQTAVAAAVS